MCRPFVFQVSHLRQLLDVVGNVGALVVAALHQIAYSNFLLADVGEQQGLYAVEVPYSEPIQLGTEKIEETPV